ncbi:unnamed protein product [Prunus brigantina]
MSSPIGGRNSIAHTPALPTTRVAHISYPITSPRRANGIITPPALPTTCVIILSNIHTLPIRRHCQRHVWETAVRRRENPV